MLDLVGRHEIADRAGTTPGLVDAWRRRHADFPPPEWIVSGTPIWRWEMVAAWLAKPRPTGRPRRAAGDTGADHGDTGKSTKVPFHCGSECPMADVPKDYAEKTNPRDLYPCGYRHWCPWCGDCEYCYGEGPHSWD